MTCGNGTMFRNKTCFNDYENKTVEFKECYMGCCPGKEIEISIDTCVTTLYYMNTYIDSYIH